MDGAIFAGVFQVLKNKKNDDDVDDKVDIELKAARA
jgi:hypothetical protein